MVRSWLEQLKVDWQAIHLMTKKTLDLEGVLQKHSEAKILKGLAPALCT